MKPTPVPASNAPSKGLAPTLALALAVIGGAVAVSVVSSTHVARVSCSIGGSRSAPWGLAGGQVGTTEGRASDRTADHGKGQRQREGEFFHRRLPVQQLGFWQATLSR